MATVSSSFDIKVFTVHRLRVNYKSLVAESRILRQEVRRCGAVYRDQLHLHRVGKVRTELRITGLALAYVRGRAYNVVEAKGSKGFDRQAVYAKLKRLDFPVTLKELENWANH